MQTNAIKLTGERFVPDYEVIFSYGRKCKYCVVIPVINEGERIGNLLARMNEIGLSDIADIIIIDGGSFDGSLDSTKLQSLKVNSLLLKLGQGRLSAQLLCAYDFALEAGYTGIVTIDGNDKDDPVGVPKMIRHLETGVDFVQGSRFVADGYAENTPFLRDIAIRFIHAPLLSVFSRHRWTDTTQGFRGYSARLLLDPRVKIFRNCFISYELLAYLSYRAPRLGFRCVEIGTIRRYPVGKVPTKISAVKGNIEVLWILLRACFGAYNPEK